MALSDQLFPEPFTRLLLVEGDDDKAFFLSLAKHLNLNNIIFIYQHAGSEHLDDALIALVNDARFELLEHLGIARDADFNTNAFSIVCSRIERANRKNPRHQLPVPERPSEPMGADLKTSVMILPGSGVEGMLEDLVLSAFDDDPAMACAEDYFACLQDNGINLKRHILPKAKSRVFLAGKAADAQHDRQTSESWEIQYLFHLNWWSWDNSVFEPVKAFLQQLATV